MIFVTKKKEVSKRTVNSYPEIAMVTPTPSD